MRKVGLLVLATVLTLAADKFASPPVPPTAKRVPNVTEVNGHKLVDNYYWLRDKTNPEVKAYLESENAYTDAVMKPTEPLQKRFTTKCWGGLRKRTWRFRTKKATTFITRERRPASSIRSVVEGKAAWMRLKKCCWM